MWADLNPFTWDVFVALSNERKQVRSGTPYPVFVIRGDRDAVVEVMKEASLNLKLEDNNPESFAEFTKRFFREHASTQLTALGWLPARKEGPLREGEEGFMSTKTKQSRWIPASSTPSRKGWYQTRTQDGFISWRAWGNGAWWKQIQGGWIEWFDGDGNAMRYEWKAGTLEDIKLNADQLPEIK